MKCPKYCSFISCIVLKSVLLPTASIKCHQTLSSFASSVCRWHTYIQIKHTIWNCAHNQMHRAVHSNVKTRMFHNKLQMNDNKTEAIFFARKRIGSEHLPKLIKINDVTIIFVLMIRDLGITLGYSLSFNQLVMNSCRSAFYELRRICSIRQYLTIDATKTIVCSLVLSMPDYCNSILSGSSKCPIKNCRRFKMQLRG